MTMNKEQICDKIIDLLTKSGGSLRLLDISKALQIKSDSKDYDKLIETLKMMIEQELIDKNARRRYALSTYKQETGIRGILHINENTGIVSTNNKEFPKIIIPNEFLYTALDGDEVRVKLILQNKKKKTRGEIVEVINRNFTTITGMVEYDGNFFFLLPEQKNLKVDFLIPTSELAGARHGDKVHTELIRWDDSAKNPQVRVKEIIGRAGDPIVEYESVIKEFKLPVSFPKQVMNEVHSIKLPENRKVKNRLDLRKKTIITIDPATAKDFDDALSLEYLDNGNYLLGVHIADVSHYISENSALDKEALKRGNSVYLVDRVIPMLPEELSNIVCSLNPNEVRYSFTVMIEINENIEVVNYKILPSMIKSSRRFNYDEVQDIIDTGEGDYSELILNLASLTKKIRKKRIAAGSINYDTREIKYLLNDEKFPIDVEIRKTTESTTLVEECMLLANKTVALHIKKLTTEYNLLTPLPFLYRIHDEPKQDSLMEAMDFVRSLGYRVHKKKITPNDINELLIRVKYNPENPVINQVLIRSMPKAVYSSTNIGHYGLGFSDYSHFTSPIRRYPDLIVHRLLKEYAVGKPTNKRIKELSSKLVEIAIHTSDTERLAMDAERASTKLASAIYASTMLGEVFDGTITGVAPYGLFILLDNIYCEGLLHTKDMQSDYYYFDAKRMRIIGKKTKNIYSLGSKIRVQVIKVNIEKRQVDLALAENK